MKDLLIYWAGILAALAGAPLLCGIINRVKSFVAGRQGPHLLQLYFDLRKLLHKSPVQSSAAGPLFRMGPAVTLTAACGTLLLLPQGAVPSPFAFTGDMLLFLYLAGTARLFTVFAAMETASSFEGMGSSRECEFAVLTEGAFLAIYGALVLMTGSLSLSGCLLSSPAIGSAVHAMAVILLLLALFVVILAECCRVPVDDPETHLELTMIHEAMILDHSGSDLAVIHYSAFLKMWVLFSFWMLILLPRMHAGLQLLLQIAGVLVLAGITGAVESCMARCRFLKVPQLLSAALGMGIMAVMLVLF